MKRAPMTSSTPLRRDTGEARLSVPVPVKRVCKVCKAFYPRVRMGQKVCSQPCSQLWAEAMRAKKATEEACRGRAELRARREAIKPRAKWLSECQAILNRYVRLRDRDLPCCSCDRPGSWDGQWHASHLRSVGAASAVRFHLWNVHKACSICNNHLSGNIAEYLPRVRARIGHDKVDWLYTQNQLVAHGVEYLKRFKAVIGKRLRRLERRAA